MIHCPRCVTPTLAGLACALVSGSAWSAGFQINEKSGSGLGTAFAGQGAWAEDASAAFYNPAVLTRLEASRQWVVAAYGVRAQSRFTDTGSCAPHTGFGSACPFGPGGQFGHAVGGDGGTLTSTHPVASLHGAWKLPGRLWAGLGLTFPFGLETDREPSWVGRFHSVKSNTLAVNFNPALAWKASDDQWAVGAGINAQRFSAEISNATSYTAIAQATQIPALQAAVPPGSEGLSVVKGADWSWGWNAGAHVMFPAGLTLGVSYRSAIRYVFRGDVRFVDRPAALGVVPDVADGAVRADIKLPDTLSLALAWKLGDVTLLADWTRTGWDSIQELNIIRADGPREGNTLVRTDLRFRNSHRLGIGASWKLAGLVLRTGIARETSPVTNANRLPILPDNDRWWLGAGLGFSLSPEGWMDLGVAYVRNDRAPMAAHNVTSASPLPRGSVVGNFKSNAVIGGVQFRWDY